MKTAAATPPCAAAMGCLCAGHARGNAATAPCDTSEVPGVTLVEALDELLAMAQEVGRTANNVVRAEHARELEGRKSRRMYDALRDARRQAANASEALHRARHRFLGRIL